MKAYLIAGSCLALSSVLACTTLPRDPEAPTPNEETLVERAHTWCEDAAQPAGPPSEPFFTDGCSSWPDGSLYPCCVEHDIAYWCGGSHGDRLGADQRFWECAEVHSPWQSGLVYYGVRMGGVPWLPFPWRWGYGHPFGSGYVEPDESADTESTLEGSEDSVR